MEEQGRGVPSIVTFTPVQIVVGVLLFIALLNNQRDLAMLALLVLGVIGGTRLWARISQWNLTYRVLIDKHRVFPGEKITISVTTENGKPLPIWLNAQIPIGNLDTSGECVLAKSTSLLWYQRAQFRWELVAARRGIYPIGPLALETGDLFSFFSRHIPTQESFSLVVYPRLARLKSFALPARDFFGVAKAPSPVQDLVYILGTRDYQHTQPSKFIHWKASARHHHLQEKVFEPTVQEKIWLVVDVNSFAQHDADDEWERALGIVASLAVRWDRRGHAIGLIANGTPPAIVPMARNDQQISSILEMLARLEMKSAIALTDLLRRELSTTWGTSCVYFSYQDDESISAAQNYFANRNIPTRVIVSQHPPEPARHIYCFDDIRAEVERV